MGKRGKDIGKLKGVVERPARGEPLDLRHRDHPLMGPWKDCRDCHIEPDWVLIYSTDVNSLRLVIIVIWLRNKNEERRFSPIACVIQSHEGLRTVVRWGLTPIVYSVALAAILFWQQRRKKMCPLTALSPVKI